MDNFPDVFNSFRTNPSSFRPAFENFVSRIEKGVLLFEATKAFEIESTADEIKEAFAFFDSDAVTSLTLNDCLNNVAQNIVAHFDTTADYSLPEIVDEFCEWKGALACLKIPMIQSPEEFISFCVLDDGNYIKSNRLHLLNTDFNWLGWAYVKNEKIGYDIVVVLAEQLMDRGTCEYTLDDYREPIAKVFIPKNRIQQEDEDAPDDAVCKEVRSKHVEKEGKSKKSQVKKFVRKTGDVFVLEFEELTSKPQF